MQMCFLSVLLGGVTAVFNVRYCFPGCLALTVLVASSLFAETRLPDRKNFHLYLLAGQSNMAGRGKVADVDKQPIARVLNFSKENKWVPAVDPLHFDKPPLVGVGIGRSFAKAVAQKRPGITIGLVPCAVGGSPISSWDPGGYHADTKTHPWDDCLKRVHAAQKYGTFKGILWHQGESDAQPDQSAVYEKKLHALIARFRGVLKAPDLPFLAGQMGRWPGRPWDAAKEKVDAAHRRLPSTAKYTAFVSSRGLNHNGDGVHFDSASYRELGKRFAAAYLEVEGRSRSTTGDARRPNVILIMADDVGYECFGCYGSRQYRTPNIDRLATEGIRFRHCYSQPLCTPSRVKLMTGVSNVRNYVAFSILNRDQRTIGQYMKLGGYRTAVAGKWQLLGAQHYAPQFRGRGTWPEKSGFEEICLWQVDQLGSRYWKPQLYVNGANRTFGPDDYGPDIVTKAVTDFIERNKDQSFFAYMPLIQVHSPFLPTPRSTSEKSRQRQRNFEDMVSYMDEQVGRVVTKIDGLGLGERTLILFTSDNGTHPTIRSWLNGSEIRGGKGKMTDAGTRVPLVGRWSGTVDPGQVTDTLIDFSDFFPTILDVAGLRIPDGLDGHSFAGLLTGEKDYRPRDWVHVYYCPRPEKTQPRRFVRDQRFKLYADGRFIDVAADCEEKTSIMDPTVDTVTAEAHAKLTRALSSLPEKGQALLQFSP